MKHWIIYGGGLVTACLLAYPYVASRFDNSEIIIFPGERFRLSNEEIESHSDAAYSFVLVGMFTIDGGWS